MWSLHIVQDLPTDAWLHQAVSLFSKQPPHVYSRAASLSASSPSTPPLHAYFPTEIGSMETLCKDSTLVSLTNCLYTHRSSETNSY